MAEPARQTWGEWWRGELPEQPAAPEPASDAPSRTEAVWAALSAGGTWVRESVVDALYREEMPVAPSLSVPPSPAKPAGSGLPELDARGPSPAPEQTTAAPPSYSRQVESFSEKVHHYVSELFAFVKEEYSRSVSLERIQTAAVDLVAAVVNALHEVFPFLPEIEIPERPQAKREEGASSAVPQRPRVRLAQSDERRKGELVERIRGLLFSRPPQIGSQEAVLAETLADLIDALTTEPKEQLFANPYLSAYINDPESQQRLTAVLERAAQQLAGNVDRGHFGKLKSKTIGRLREYCTVSLPILMDHRSGWAMRVDQKRGHLLKQLQQQGLTIPEISFRTLDHKGEIKGYLNETLKARIAHALPQERYELVIGPMAAVMAEVLSQMVVSMTSPEMVDGYFHNLMTTLDDQAGASAPSTPPSASKPLSSQEDTDVMALLEVVARELCQSQSAVTFLRFLKTQAIDAINQGIGRVVTADALELGFVNRLLAEQVKTLKQKKGAPKPEQRRLVGLFFPRPERELTVKLPGIWPWIAAVQGHMGLRRLKAFLTDYPEWSMNAMCLIMCDALDEFLPLPRVEN